MMRCSGANLTPACLVVPVKAERPAWLALAFAVLREADNAVPSCAAVKSMPSPAPRRCAGF